MSGTRGGARLVGIDLARLVAVAGMMAAHTLHRGDQPPSAGVVALIDGPPSTLFAVLGGVSVVLAARSRLAIGDRGGAVRSTLARGLAVALLGFLVIPLAGAVYVVLVPFGVAIMVAALLVLLPTWLLVALATLLAAGSGWLVALARERLPGLEGAHSVVQLLGDPLAAANDVLLNGVYPALTWTAYLAIGILVARAILAARRSGRERWALVGLAGGGALLVAAGIAASEIGVRLLAGGRDAGAARDELLANAYGAVGSTEPAFQLLAAPHSGTPADIARTAGIALLVIALLGLLASALPAAALRVIEPARAAGGAPLTIYIVHVVLISVMGGLLVGAAPWAVGGWSGWALQLLIALGIGAVLAAQGRRGPFERLVGWIAGRAGGRHEAGEPQPYELAGDTGIVYEWRFRAPIDEVWRALTEPELLRAWIADPQLPVTSAWSDLRTGGSYRLEHRRSAGDLVVRGEYLQVEPPTLLVESLHAEGDGRPPVLSTSMLAQHGDVTTVRVREEWESPELRGDALGEMRVVAAMRHRLAALVER